MASITAPARTAFDSKNPLLLPVPYFSQRDSATGQGDRMVFVDLRHGSGILQARLSGRSWPTG